MGIIFPLANGICPLSIGTSVLVLLVVEGMYKSPFLTISCPTKNLPLPIGMYLVKYFFLYSIEMGPHTCLVPKKFSNRIFVSSIPCLSSTSSFFFCSLSAFFSSPHASQNTHPMITFHCFLPSFYPFWSCKPFYLLPISIYVMCSLFSFFSQSSIGNFYSGLYSILLWLHDKYQLLRSCISNVVILVNGLSFSCSTFLNCWTTLSKRHVTA
jgi:hypothetical protein